MILWGLVPWRVIVGPSLCFGAMNDEFLFFDETSTQDCSFIEILRTGNFIHSRQRSIEQRLILDWNRTVA